MCLAGKYKSTAGSTDCRNCPAGSSSPEQSAALTDCTCNAGYSGRDGGQCVVCTQGKYKSVTGFGSCDDCPASSDSPIGSTVKTSCTCNAGWTGPAGGPCIVVVHVVKMAVSLPMTKSDFTEEKQSKFRESIGKAAGVVKLADVALDKIETITSRRDSNRRLLSGSIRVHTNIKAPDESAAVAMANAIDIDKINRELEKVGLPKATMLESPKASTVEPPNVDPVQENQQKTSNNSVTTIAVVCAVVVTVLSIVSGVFFWKKRALTKLHRSQICESNTAATDHSLVASSSQQSHSIQCIPDTVESTNRICSSLHQLSRQDQLNVPVSEDGFEIHYVSIEDGLQKVDLDEVLCDISPSNQPISPKKTSTVHVYPAESRIDVSQDEDVNSPISARIMEFRRTMRDNESVGICFDAEICFDADYGMIIEPGVTTRTIFEGGAAEKDRDDLSEHAVATDKQAIGSEVGPWKSVKIAELRAKFEPQPQRDPLL